MKEWLRIPDPWPRMSLLLWKTCDFDLLHYCFESEQLEVDGF